MKFESEFKKEIAKVFENKRIISLLYFGTRAFVGASDDSDYDFILILDRYNPSDILKVQKIIQKKKFKYSDFNINFLYLTDLKSRGKENFQIRSVQSSFYQYLENSITLIGKNIFKQHPLRLSKHKLADLMDFKIQEYYGRCDKLFFQHVKEKDLYKQIKKYVRDMIRFTLVREGIMTLKDITKYSFEDIFALATQYEVYPKSIIVKFSVLTKGNLNRKDIKNIEFIRRGVYQKYLKLFSGRS